jgi:hypothetical protein
MRIIRQNGVIVVFIGILSVAVATAQSPALDPVRVAPHIFESVLENGQVRVLKVTERNGETAPLHSHPARVVVHLSPCAWMQDAADGSRQMQSFRLGDVRWLNRATHGGETSAVVQECSMLEIELK